MLCDRFPTQTPRNTQGFAPQGVSNCPPRAGRARCCILRGRAPVRATRLWLNGRRGTIGRRGRVYHILGSIDTALAGFSDRADPARPAPVRPQPSEYALAVSRRRPIASSMLIGLSYSFRVADFPVGVLGGRRLIGQPSSRTGAKPAVRNEWGGVGNVGIVRSPLRVIA